MNQAKVAPSTQAHPRLTPAQRAVLAELRNGFHGYCDLMQAAGLTSYMACDWVLNALERRALVSRDDDYSLTDAGRALLAKVQA